MFNKLNDECVINILSYLQTHKNIIFINKRLYEFKECCFCILNNRLHITDDVINNFKYINVVHLNI